MLVSIRSSKWLVRGISFEINKGQIVTLIGPNGSKNNNSQNDIEYS